MVGALVLPPVMTGHDRGVGHPQPVYADHPEFFVDDGVGAPPHATRADRVKLRGHGPADPSFDIGIAPHLRSGLDLAGVERLESLLRKNVTADVDGPAEQIDVAPGPER